MARDGSAITMEGSMMEIGNMEPWMATANSTTLQKNLLTRVTG